MSALVGASTNMYWHIVTHMGIMHVYCLFMNSVQIPNTSITKIHQPLQGVIG